MYKLSRNYENAEKVLYVGIGKYDTPVIVPHEEEIDVENWIGFNYARGCDEPQKHGVHFFLDDYQFQRVWTRPDVYANMLSRFKVVCAPDFSVYLDFPKALQVYNHYRKHWVARYWQEHGVTVIPTINWAYKDSFDWCFDGEPYGGVVAVSSVGEMGSKELRKLFMDGYNEMMDRLHPRQIIFHGEIPDECEGNIVQIPTYQMRLRQIDIDKGIHRDPSKIFAQERRKEL